MVAKNTAMDIRLDAVRFLIRSRMVDKDISQDTLASKTGMTKPGVSNFLNGKMGINLTTLLRIFDALDIKMVLAEKD